MPNAYIRININVQRYRTDDFTHIYVSNIVSMIALSVNVILIVLYNFSLKIMKINYERFSGLILI